MKALLLTIQKLWPIQIFLWTNRRTNGRAKNYMPPIYRCGDIKKQALNLSFDESMTVACSRFHCVEVRYTSV